MLLVEPMFIQSSLIDIYQNVVTYNCKNVVAILNSLKYFKIQKVKSYSNCTCRPIRIKILLFCHVFIVKAGPALRSQIQRHLGKLWKMPENVLDFDEI